MFYRTKSQLPDSVRDSLPDDGQDLYIQTFNLNHNKLMSEQNCAGRAWMGVKAKYKPMSKGKKTTYVKMSEAEELLAKQSLDARRKLVSAAIEEHFKILEKRDYAYAYIEDLFESEAVVARNGKLWSFPYAIVKMNKQQQVMLGEPKEVQVAYKSIESTEPGTVRCREITILEGEYDAEKGQIPITVIRPGFNKSKSRFYPPEVLKRDHGVFEGLKMMSDHPTRQEEEARPEGSIRNWVGVTSGVHVREDGSVGAIATIVDDALKAKLKNLREAKLSGQMGVSIRAIAEGKDQEIEGTRTTVIEKLTRGKTVDFVTFAGAGGQVEAAESDDDEDFRSVESQRRETSMDQTDKQDFLNRITALETGIATEKAARETAEKKLETVEAEKKKAVAGQKLEELLTAAKLPDLAKVRLRKQFATAETVEGMEAAIKEEQEYIASITPTKTGVKNMGESKESDGTDGKKKVDLKESFKALGLDDKAAEIAAAGR